MSLINPTSGKSLFSIPKLQDGGGNWVTYKDRMWNLLIGMEGFRRHLTGRAKEPTKPSDEDDDTAMDAYEDLMDSYLQKQSAIRTIILSSIPETLHIQLIHSKNAQELWLTLCGRYDNQSAMVKSDIFGQLNDLRCGDEGNPLTTIDQILKLANDYASAGGELHDDQASAIISRAMPAKYRPLINTVTSAARQLNKTLSSSELISHLTEAIKFDQGQERREREEEVAMQARYKDYKSKSGNRSSARPEYTQTSHARTARKSVILDLSAGAKVEVNMAKVLNRSPRKAEERGSRLPKQWRQRQRKTITPSSPWRRQSKLQGEMLS